MGIIYAVRVGTNTPVFRKHLQVEFISRSFIKWAEGQKWISLEESVSEVLCGYQQLTRSSYKCRQKGIRPTRIKI